MELVQLLENLLGPQGPEILQAAAGLALIIALGAAVQLIAWAGRIIRRR